MRTEHVQQRDRLARLKLLDGGHLDGFAFGVSIRGKPRKHSPSKLWGVHFVQSDFSHAGDAIAVHLSEHLMGFCVWRLGIPFWRPLVFFRSFGLFLSIWGGQVWGTVSASPVLRWHEENGDRRPWHSCQVPNRKTICNPLGSRFLQSSRA